MLSADEDKNCKVYYISTVGAHKNGNPRGEGFMFDILTKNIDMRSLSAIPIDIKDLIDSYNKTHSEFEIFYDRNERNGNRKMKKRKKYGSLVSPLPVDVYEVLEHFIEEKKKLDPDANFIVDELPILLDGKLHFLYSWLILYQLKSYSYIHQK